MAAPSLTSIDPPRLDPAEALASARAAAEGFARRLADVVMRPDRGISMLRDVFSIIAERHADLLDRGDQEGLRLLASRLRTPIVPPPPTASPARSALRSLRPGAAQSEELAQEIATSERSTTTGRTTIAETAASLIDVARSFETDPQRRGALDMAEAVLLWGLDKRPDSAIPVDAAIQAGARVVDGFTRVPIIAGREYSARAVDLAVDVQAAAVVDGASPEARRAVGAAFEAAMAASGADPQTAASQRARMSWLDRMASAIGIARDRGRPAAEPTDDRSPRQGPRADNEVPSPSRSLSESVAARGAALADYLVAVASSGEMGRSAVLHATSVLLERARVAQSVEEKSLLRETAFDMQRWNPGGAFSTPTRKVDLEGDPSAVGTRLADLLVATQRDGDVGRAVLAEAAASVLSRAPDLETDGAQRSSARMADALLSWAVERAPDRKASVDHLVSSSARVLDVYASGRLDLARIYPGAQQIETALAVKEAAVLDRASPAAQRELARSFTKLVGNAPIQPEEAQAYRARLAAYDQAPAARGRARTSSAEIER